MPVVTATAATTAATTAVATTATATGTTATAGTSAATASAEKLRILRTLTSTVLRTSGMTALQDSGLVDEFAQPIYMGIAMASTPSQGTKASPPQTDATPIKPHANSPEQPILQQEKAIPSTENTVSVPDDADLLHPVIESMLDTHYPAPTIESQLNSGMEKIVIERDIVDQRFIDNGTKSKTAVCLIQERVIDRKYLEYGNLSDFIAEIRHGNIPTIHQFFLAVVDLTDAATFKILRPYLERYKLEGAQYQLRQLSVDLQTKVMPSQLMEQKSRDFGIDRKVKEQAWYKSDQVTERTGHHASETIRESEIVVMNFKELCSVEMSQRQVDDLLSTRKQFSDLIGAKQLVRLESSLTAEQIADVNKNAVVWVRENVITTTKDWTTDETFHRYWTDWKKTLGSKVEPSEVAVQKTLQSNFSEYLSTSDNINLEELDTYKQACEKFHDLEKTASLSADKMLIDEYKLASSGVEFKDGWITYVPLGSVVNLGAKADLGCKLTAMDWVWAGVDVATVAVAIVTLGASSGLTAGAKTAVVSGGKTALKAGGKVALQNGTKAGSKALGQAGAKAGTRAGAKATVQTGAKAGQAGAKAGGTLGAKTSGELAENSAKAATKTGFKANSTQVIDGFTYVTDKEGRVIKATGKLKLEKGTRVPSNQGTAAQWGKAGDQGGHLIPANYGGSGELINHVPQAGKVNQSVVKRIENEMGRALKDGKVVDYRVCPHYPAPGALRPDKFTIRYTIDGVQKIRRITNG